MATDEPNKRYLYWLEPSAFAWARDFLEEEGYQFEKTSLTPCQVLKARGRRLAYAPPEIWSGMCRRQGSWYRESARAGETMIMSDHPLPNPLGMYLDVEMRGSDFAPERLPDRRELESVVNSAAYRERKPADWERIGWKDSLLFKIFFTFTRFWGRKDTLATKWLGHRANHANFLARHFTTTVDGEEVPYSVTGNDAVCSSCAEFFNVVEPQSRKLVRACPGSVVIGGAQRDAYYDVKPLGTRTE